MTSFSTTESFEIPITRQRLGGRKIDKTSLIQFLTQTGEYSSQRGCYVFSMKAGKGEKPWYLGKASRQAFSKECFAPATRYDKLAVNYAAAVALAAIVTWWT